MENVNNFQIGKVLSQDAALHFLDFLPISVLLIKTHVMHHLIVVMSNKKVIALRKKFKKKVLRLNFGWNDQFLIILPYFWKIYHRMLHFVSVIKG